MAINRILRELQPLLGAARLAMFDIKGLTRVEDTPRAVWISFIPALMMLPLMLWIASMESGADPENFPFFRQGLSYTVSVFGFPLVMYYIARFMDRGGRWRLMTAAVNWTTPVQVLWMGIGMFFYFWNVVPGTGDAILMIISIYNMAYLWFTVRASLKVSGSISVLLVCLMALIQLVSVLLTQVHFS